MKDRLGMGLKGGRTWLIDEVAAASGRRAAKREEHYATITHNANLAREKTSAAAIDTTRGCSYLWDMEVHFAPDREAQLKRFAASKGKDVAQVVEETVIRMLEQQAQFIEGVNRGIAASDRDDFVDHDEVIDRIDRLFHS